MKAKESDDKLQHLKEIIQNGQLFLDKMKVEEFRKKYSNELRLLQGYNMNKLIVIYINYSLSKI